MIRTPFDLTDPLPSGRAVIEASAGTGKTYSLTGLIARYVAEADVSVDQFLVVTFTRAAANDLRDRTRQVLQLAAHVVGTGDVPDNHPWMSVLLEPTARSSELADRRRRLADAINRFDDLTITTIHGFCQHALAQLGVRAGTDLSAVLVENTHDLIAEVCRDLIVTELADNPRLLDSPKGSDRKVRTPTQAENQLIANVTAVIANPGARTAPHLPHSRTSTATDDIANDRMASRWLQLTSRALDGVVERQRMRGEIGYDTLISGLRDALLDPVTGRAVADQLAQRSSVVLVDEFQDTDPLQWDVFQTAFAGRTLITVGDPKQAIYRFRGADVHAYLDAVEHAPMLTLATNHRSDREVLDGLEKLFSGATLGDPRIRFTPVRARPSAPANALGRRCEPAPSAAVQLRISPLDDALRAGQKKDLSMPLVRTLVLADLIQRTIDLLDNGIITGSVLPGTSAEQRPVQPGDIAVLVPSHAEANNVAEAMRRARIPAVRTRTGSVMRTPAATQWRLLLAAMSEPHRAPVVRAAALGWFLPTDVVALAESDEVLIELQERVAQMADRLRLVGINSFYDEQKSLSPTHTWGCGLLQTVLGREGGDRHLTDVDHIAELLSDAMHGRSCDPAQVMRTLDDLITGTDERSEASMRRIDSDSLAVQITTIHAAKGLEYPIVLVPFCFKQRANLYLPHSYTAPDGRRTLDLASTVGWDSGTSVPGDETTRCNQEARRQLANLDTEGDELRLLYVALTRAVHRVEVWWACTQRANGSALGRVLLDRDGCAAIRNTEIEFHPKVTAAGLTKTGFTVTKPAYQDLSEPDVSAQLHKLAKDSGGSIEITELPAHIAAPVWAGNTAAPTAVLRAATSRLRRTVFDPSWKRWSFSRLGAQLEAGSADGFATNADPGGLGVGGGASVDLDRGGYDEPADPDDEDIGPTEHELASEPPTGPVHLPPTGHGGTVEQLSLWPVPADDEPHTADTPSGPTTPVTLVAALADVAGGTRFGTFVHTVLETLDFASADLAVRVRRLVIEHARRNGLELPLDDVVAGLLAALRTPLGPLFAGRSLAEIPAGDRLAELTFDMPLLAGRSSTAPLTAGAIGDILLDTLAPRDPLRPFAAQLAADMAELDIAGWMHGSIDAVFRIPDQTAGRATGHGHRYLVVDYKTNRLHEPGAADPVAAYRPDRLVPAMEHSRYPLQALLYTVAVHRYLRWRLGSAYSPDHHLGGVGYLFVRGMVGPDTPTADGVAHGVFSWRPPTATVTEIDHLFATGSRS